MTTPVPDPDPAADPGPIEIDALSAAVYGDGKDPIDWAVYLAKIAIEVRDRVATYPHRGTGALAGWADVSDGALARKIVGSLLDAGWHPPSADEIQVAAARHDAATESYRTWMASLTDLERLIVRDHFDQTGEFPPDLQPPADHHATAVPKG